MLKRIITISFVGLLLCGCGRVKEPAAIKIGDICVNPVEFERAFKNSPYSATDTPESRRVFLDSYITRMLILKEAVDKRLDKDGEFLRGVESFWQQSLIKIMLDRKIKELTAGIKVSDVEIKAYYGLHKNAEFKDKDLQAVYDDIKWRLLNAKQQDSINSWLDSLKGSSKIEIDYSSLKINK